MRADWPGPVLVTGGSGFIGQHLVDRLRAREIPHRTFGRTARNDVAGDLRNTADIERAVAGMHTVFHLAAQAHDRRTSLDATHLAVGREGTEALLAAATKAGVERVVFASSLAVYGSSFTQAVTENTVPQPDTAYGASKLAAERQVLGWGQSSPGRHAVCVRPAMTYGAGAKGNLPRLMRAISRGVCPPIPRSAAKRSVLHVESLVDILMLAAVRETANHEVFNAADRQPVSTAEMYDWLMAGFGRRPPVWRVPKAAFRAAAAAGAIAERILGSAPFTPRAYRTLFEPAVASVDHLEARLGYASSRSFEASVPELIAEFA